MAEVKNSFIRSKMNQDLDDRLIPNGEYREAFNVSINKSIGENVGTLQTVLGNELVAIKMMVDDFKMKWVVIGLFAMLAILWAGSEFGPALMQTFN